MAERYVVMQRNAILHLHRWIVIDTQCLGAPVAYFYDSLPNAEEEAHFLCSRLNKIGEAPRDLTMVEVRSMLYRINRKCNEIRTEIRHMTPAESPLDQAIDNLGTAATNKLAEDQIVDGLASQAVDQTAETAKIQGITDELNKETAAEQALVASQTPAPPATPDPAAPAPDAGTATDTASTGTTGN